ncbi:hypothetical protein BU23DRAFT_636276 [Bimuria novae-zelandiae CBS 107.79]|uniref:DUF4185 domain-containing protein n=1 Tax=Bimuria novae-zelandiae CBS 107.79 TaxID=1447943 RepID=A0A6A5VCR6_9PLEO|nr:hypothetical protein BU23DRAFT_636276 [Bimuria novae-zelandiae CBS 107.79]
MDRFKSAFANLTNKTQTRATAEEGFSNVARQDTVPSGRLAWPPRLTCPPKVRGEVKDASGRQYPRDLGRSVKLGGHIYYIFGDTFCFNDGGEFVGVTNNTIALIPGLNNPTGSQYLHPDPKVPEFVPYLDEEREFCEREENLQENRRIVTWSFGGFIEKPDCGGREAWLICDPVETHGGDVVRQLGVGIAKARVTSHKGGIECERVGPFPLFPGDGPIWGSISNISALDGYTYLLSRMGLDNYMARIRTNADFTDPNKYQFLKKSGCWEPTYTEPYGPFGELAHDVLSGQGQGAIIYVPQFAPRGKKYLWIGCEKFMTSQLCVGTAARPEGPWDVHKLGEMPKISEQSKTRYCIYPHLWGSDLRKGEILITWSDDGTMGGKVVAGVFTFALD